MMSDDLPVDLLPFKHRLSPRFYEAREQVNSFIQNDVIPRLPEWNRYVTPRHVSKTVTYHQQTNTYRQRRELERKAAHPTMAPMPPMHHELVRIAKKRKIFNFFLPEVCGLSVLEYAPIQEILGTVPQANYAMNCSAPDTGNMEVLEKFGTPEQKKTWLEPLLRGEIRSCFAMTEPGVASSDATNISTTIRLNDQGTHYVINGHKWYISGAIRPECKVAVLLGRSSDTGPRHKQHSMILVPMDTPGVTILRPLALFGHEHDHAEILFRNVVVPKSNILLGEGRGFEVGVFLTYPLSHTSKKPTHRTDRTRTTRTWKNTSLHEIHRTS